MRAFSAALFLLAVGLASAAPVALPVAIYAPETILGVRPGMDRDDVHDALKLLGTTRTQAEADAKDAKASAAKSGDGDEEGKSELWTLRATAYAQVVFNADAGDHVLWVTGFLRPGQEIPFGRFGDPKRALVFRDGLAVWNVLPSGKSALPPYRLIARGVKGQARSVSLISLAPPKAHGQAGI